MIKRIIPVLIALILLVGCNQPSAPPQPHKISMDQLTLTLPDSFTQLTDDDLQAAFAYSQEDICIHGFQESKEEIHEFYEYISLESYVRMLAESIGCEMSAQITDEIWNYTYTQELDGVEYTFLCGFFETQESFWRIQVSCPTAQFAENQEMLWKYIREIS